ncbi:TPA: HAD family phosphatase [Candidatus Scatousia excrementigallinarum]|uniref:HAD family phosphatase n=1 Tax=Candidatus Scatousia excrementigallinarum TaxID=2840935 RepID=A0A9D1JMZ8_9BACT|nr:HAD family phosphatase [Candidatus Scatousia excrementigallinarum]
MQYKGIIFDFNGTLFWDSEKHLEAWREFSKRVRPYAFTDDEMREYMFGRTNEDILAYLIGRRPEPELVEKLGSEKEAVYRQMCKDDEANTRLAPYAVEFLDYLKENNILRTIATMSNKANVDFYIEQFNLANWFDIDKIVYDDKTIKGKPAPDIYEIAAAKLNLKPQDCIVVEDALSGIEAARAANIGKIVAIASMDPVDLYTGIPAVTEVITDFSDFEKIMDKSPVPV